MTTPSTSPDVRSGRSRLGLDPRWQRREAAEARGLHLEDVLEAEKRASILRWARTGVAALAAKGDGVFLPPGKTVEDLQKALPAPKPPVDRRRQGTFDYREIAAKILAHLRAGTVTTVNQAAKLMGIPSGTCYTAWSRWGPANWTQPGAAIRETPVE